jgi:TPR repeat protein
MLADARRTIRQRKALLWEKADDFDEATSNEWTLWNEHPAEIHEQYKQAASLWNSDPAKAYALHREAADAGLTRSMISLGSYHEKGIGCAKDLDRAIDHYWEATVAGSWYATIYYANALARKKSYSLCFEVLEDGVDGKYLAAFFWLPWHRFKQNSSRKTCREVRPLIDQAIEQGHPAARLLLGQMLMSGKFGFGQIKAGKDMLAELGFELHDELEAKAETSET